MNLATLLLRLSEGGGQAVLWGRTAKPHFGRDFDRLLSRGVLIEQAPATEWDVCADCECGLQDRPVRRVSGLLVATCPLDHARDEPLDGDDLRSFTIEAAALVREIAAASGFESSPSEVVPGAWDLGLSPSNRGVLLVLSRSTLQQAGLLPAIQSARRKMPVTIVGPSVAPADELRLVAANVYFVPTTHAFGIDRSALALDQSCLAPPATTAPRLTLNRPRRTLVLDGQEIQAAPRPFSLLWLLAESIVKGGGVVSQRQIESHLWGKQAISRTAVGDAVRDLRDVLDAIPQSEGVASELIENRPGQGYLLNLSADDIELVV